MDDPEGFNVLWSFFLSYTKFFPFFLILGEKKELHKIDTYIL